MKNNENNQNRIIPIIIPQGSYVEDKPSYGYDDNEIYGPF